MGVRRNSSQQSQQQDCDTFEDVNYYYKEKWTRMFLQDGCGNMRKSAPSMRAYYFGYINGNGHTDTDFHRRLKQMMATAAGNPGEGGLAPLLRVHRYCRTAEDRRNLNMYLEAVHKKKMCVYNNGLIFISAAVAAVLGAGEKAFYVMDQIFDRLELFDYCLPPYAGLKEDLMEIRIQMHSCYPTIGDVFKEYDDAAGQLFVLLVQPWLTSLLLTSLGAQRLEALMPLLDYIVCHERMYRGLGHPRRHLMEVVTWIIGRNRLDFEVVQSRSELTVLVMKLRDTVVIDDIILRLTSGSFSLDRAGVAGSILASPAGAAIGLFAGAKYALGVGAVAVSPYACAFIGMLAGAGAAAIPGGICARRMAQDSLFRMLCGEPSTDDTEVSAEARDEEASVAVHVQLPFCGASSSSESFARMSS